MHNSSSPYLQLPLSSVENGSLRRALPNCTIGLQSDLAKENYQSYLDDLYIKIDKVIDRIEMHPIHREHDSEDRTSIEIVNALRYLNFPAEHEASYGGNCDICINDQEEFIWLGEAKIDYSNTHIMEGFRQLVDRYASGAIRDGGLFIYCKDNAPKVVIDNWKSYLRQKDNKTKEYSVRFLDDSGKNYFITEHFHKSSRQIFRVKHIAISLYDVATDKSAKKKKKCTHTCDQCCPVVKPKKSVC